MDVCEAGEMSECWDSEIELAGPRKATSTHVLIGTILAPMLSSWGTKFARTSLKMENEVNKLVLIRFENLVFPY